MHGSFINIGCSVHQPLIATTFSALEQMVIDITPLAFEGRLHNALAACKLGKRSDTLRIASCLSRCKYPLLQRPQAAPIQVDQNDSYLCSS
jgi:hypothetical protein